MFAAMPIINQQTCLQERRLGTDSPQLTRAI
jgi:hypothetical protein